MKDKILVLIIGILIGAILASVGFLIYNKQKSNDVPSLNSGMPQMENFSPRDMKDRAMPDNQNGQMPNEDAPSGEMPSEEKQFKNKKSKNNTTNTNTSSTI